jgi:hypothetical protein
MLDRPELSSAELLVLRTLATLRDTGTRWPSPVEVSDASGLTYATVMGAVRQLVYTHGYVVSRVPAAWGDGVTITTTGQGVLDGAAATLGV